MAGTAYFADIPPHSVEQQRVLIFLAAWFLLSIIGFVAGRRGHIVVYRGWGDVILSALCLPTVVFFFVINSGLLKSPATSVPLPMVIMSGVASLILSTRIYFANQSIIKTLVALTTQMLLIFLVIILPILLVFFAIVAIAQVVEFFQAEGNKKKVEAGVGALIAIAATGAAGMMFGITIGQIQELVELGQLQAISSSSTANKISGIAMAKGFLFFGILAAGIFSTVWIFTVPIGRDSKEPISYRGYSDVMGKQANLTASGSPEVAKASRQFDEGLKLYREKKYESAMNELQLAALAGDIRAESYIGFMYHEGLVAKRDNEAAFDHLAKAATTGDDRAQYMLGVMYRDGDGVKIDGAQAVKWLTLASDQRDSDAEWALGRMYHEADGVPKDDKKAAVWLKKAADHGQVKAQTLLGIMYLTGDGVSRDNGEAVRFMTAAADGGDIQSQYNLGVIYMGGHGIDQDLGKAKQWLLRAAQAGSADAKSLLERQFPGASG